MSLRLIWVLTVVALPAIAQSGKQPTNEELVSAGDRLRDTTVLRDLPMLKIGFVGVQNTTDLTMDEARKLVFGIFSRYNLPVEWTPPTQSVRVDRPTVTVMTSVLKNSWEQKGSQGGFVTNYVRVRFELEERIKLPRQPTVEWNVPVWTEEDEITFGSAAIDKNTVVEMIKRLTERFCLSYLSANR